MLSIKERLYIYLILVLLIILAFFGSLGVYMHYYLGWLMTIEEIALYIGLWAPSLPVIYAIGLRLIDDTLKRYENFASSRIRQLRDKLNSSKPEIHNYNTSNFSNIIKEVLENSSNLKKHGRYFITKLYPEDTLKKIELFSKDMEKTSKKFKELQSKWNDDRFFHQFIQVVFRNGSFGSLIPNLVPYNYRILTEKSDVVKKENPELFKSIETLRKDLLKAIDEIVIELDDFYNTN